MGTGLCKGQAGTVSGGSCPGCGRAAGTHRALPGTGGQLAESLWVRIRRQTSVGSIVGGVCYRPTDQGEVHKASSARHLEILVLTEDFNHPDNLLQGQCSRTQAVLEVFEVN